MADIRVCSHGKTSPCDECELAGMLALRKKLDPDAPDMIVFPDPTKAASPLVAGKDYEDRHTATNKELREELIAAHRATPRQGEAKQSSALVVTRNGVPCEDQAAALEEFKQACQAPLEDSPERIRVIVRPGKDDWIGVAYSSSAEPNDVIREYVRPSLTSSEKWLNEIELACNAALLDIYDLSIANAPLTPEYARQTADCIGHRIGQIREAVTALRAKRGLKSLYNELAESVLTAPIEDLEEEIRAEGRDPKEVAEEVREVMKNAVRKCSDVK